MNVVEHILNIIQLLEPYFKDYLMAIGIFNVHYNMRNYRIQTLK